MSLLPAMPRRRTKPKRKLPPGYKKFLAELKPLVAEVVRVKAEMKAAGLFTDDRELLECPRCRLQEDVTIGGKLITCEPTSPGVETGLRFTPLDGAELWWCCPRCGTELAGDGFGA